MCTDAYRQALIRELSSTPSPAQVELPDDIVATDAVAPTPERTTRLDNLTQAVGHHYQEARALVLKR